MRHPWTFTQRIAVGFAASLVLALAIAGAAVLALRSVSASNAQSVVEQAAYLQRVERLRGAFGEKVSASRGYLLTGNSLFLVEAGLARSQFLEAQRELFASTLEERDRRRLEELARAEEAHEEAVAGLVALRAQGPLSPERLEALFVQSVSPARQQALRLMAQLYWQGEEALRQEARQATEADLRAFWFILAAAALGLLLAAGLAWVLTRELRPLHQEAESSEECLRLLVEGVKDYALYLVDVRGRVASWNPGGERIQGWRAEEVVGCPESLLYPEKEAREGGPRELLERAALEGRLEVQGWRVRRDGTHFWAETLFTALRDAQGRLKGYAVLTRDITERRRIESAQHLFMGAERLFHAWQDPDRAMAELVQLPVPELADGAVLFLLSLAGELEARAVVHVSEEKKRVLWEMVQYARRLEKERPHGAWGVLRSGRSERVAEVTPEVEEEAAGDAHHLELIRALGVCSSLMVPLRVGERPLGVLVLISHQAERRYTETDQVFVEELAGRAALALDNARLLREAQAALELIGVAAHDLGNPLNALQMQLGRLRRMPSAEAEKLQEGLGAALRHTQRLGRLLHNLLDLSRLSSGRLELESAEVDLTELVHELAARHAEQVEASGSRLELDVELGVVGRWDRMRLERVLTNLLSNALKYGRGQPVVMRVSRVQGHARLEVRDHGPGIPPEEQRHIFERFKRASSAGEKAGFGLGLYIVRQLVEAHGGSIRVESAPGQGAAFIVELPLSPEYLEMQSESHCPELLH